MERADAEVGKRDRGEATSRKIRVAER